MIRGNNRHGAWREILEEANILKSEHFKKKICVQKVSEVDKIRGKNIKVNVAVALQRCGLGAK